MHFGKKNHNNTDYYMNGQRLLTVTEEKDLGVVISSDMKSSQQCFEAYSKASRILAMIDRSIVYKNSGNLVRLYKSPVRPHLEYCTAAWSPHYVKDKVLLERIQRWFTRMIQGLKNLKYENRLRELNLWSLEDRRVRADLVEVFEIVRGLSSIKPKRFFSYSTTKE